MNTYINTYTCRTINGDYIKEYDNEKQAINYALKDNDCFYVEYEVIDNNSICYFSKEIWRR